MKRIVCLILLFPFLLYSHAQEQFVPPEANLITSFSFNLLSGGVVIVRARVDDIKDTLNFVLDTGSGGISLDSSTVEEFHLTSILSDKTIRGIGGMKRVYFTYHHSLKLPGLTVDSLDFHINDYDLLTSVYGVKIDGIIGYSFLRRYIVKVNYDSLKIDVLRPGSIKYPKGGYLMRPRFNSFALPIMTVEDDHSVVSRFIFDTGAGLCFLLSQDFVTDSGVLRKNRKIYPTQVEGLGGKKLMNTTIIKSISFGPYKFKKVPVYIFEDDFNVTSYPQLGGLIGNDLLRRFNLIINYPDQCIYLKPNSHFNDWFDYSYTGLGIYQVGNEVQVVDIIKGSPGDIAGFQSGDIVVSLDNIFIKNIQALKAALQNAGARLKVIVIRNGQPVMLKLHIRNMSN
jgi:hypothetical protein